MRSKNRKMFPTVLWSILCIMCCGLAVEAKGMSRGVYGSIDPQRAVIAAVIMVVVGVVIFLTRNYKSIRRTALHEN